MLERFKPKYPRNTPVDGFKDEDFPDFEKSRPPGALPNGMVPEPNSGVQPASRKRVLRKSLCKGKKHQRSKSVEEVEGDDEKEEAGAREGNEETICDVQIIGEASSPPPPPP